MRGLTLNPADTVFLPALSSRETVATEDNTFWQITRYCARKTGTSFVGDAVTKNPHPPLQRAHGAAQRQAILAQANYRCRPFRGLNIFIFDDFVTQGSTLSHTATAIRAANPRTRIYGVALGRNESLDYHRKHFGRDLTNAHVPAKWNQIWTKHDA